MLCFSMVLTGSIVFKEYSAFFFEGWEVLDKFFMTEGEGIMFLQNMMLHEY